MSNLEKWASLIVIVFLTCLGCTDSRPEESIGERQNKNQRFDIAIINESNVVVLDRLTGRVWRKMFSTNSTSISDGGLWENWGSPAKKHKVSGMLPTPPRYSLKVAGTSNVIVFNTATGEIWRRMFPTNSMKTRRGAKWEVWPGVQ
ncbi:hypothetical protein JYT83_00915 [bacterium AH-315-F18]|nr:hypothetical protein [bacterium AH-315-F18]